MSSDTSLGVSTIARTKPAPHLRNFFLLHGGREFSQIGSKLNRDCIHVRQSGSVNSFWWSVGAGRTTNRF